MISFHGFLLLILITIGVLACWLLFFVIKKYNSTTSFQSIKFTHSSILEIIWTIIPALILLIIASPSFVLLYSLDEYVDPALTLKVIGHQWY
jgi:heme/copper-type cytochrome/quinol oxidase subunit 2